jgi:DNA-binding IclR family transcriptional regulator
MTVRHDMRTSLPAPDYDEAADTDAALPQAYLVSSLEKGLRILTEFSAREPVLGTSELSKRLNAPRTTAYRLLQTLETLGFLERDGRVHFRLGVSALRIGFQYLDSLRLTQAGTPVLERLRDACALDSHLMMRDGREVVCIASVQVRNQQFGITANCQVGTRLPAHATGYGHVLMGTMTDEEITALYLHMPLERFSDHTPGTTRSLIRHIRESLTHDYTIDLPGGHLPYAAIIAAVYDHSGKIVAALGSLVQESDVHQPREREVLGQQVHAAALELSICLGYRPDVDRTLE